MQFLYKGVEEGFEKQTPAFKKAFGSMFSSWEHRLRRFGAIEKHPDFLAETMVGMMEQTVNSYTLKDIRDSYKIHNGEIDGKIIYFGDFHDEYNIYTPRNMRMGIMRYGLDGYERVKPKYLAAREGLVTYDSNLFDFCFRLLNRAKGRLNNVSPELFS